MDSTLVLLEFMLGPRILVGGLRRLVEELSADGNVDTLLLVVAREGGTNSSF